jgi:hypothetical protein
MVAFPSLKSQIRDIDCDCMCCITYGLPNERQKLLNEKPEIPQDFLDQVVVIVDPENQQLHLARKPGWLRKKISKGAAKRHSERMDDVFRRCTNGLCMRDEAIDAAKLHPKKKGHDFMTLREYKKAKAAALAKKAEKEELGITAARRDIEAPEFEEMWVEQQ